MSDIPLRLYPCLADQNLDASRSRDEANKYDKLRSQEDVSVNL